MPNMPHSVTAGHSHSWRPPRRIRNPLLRWLLIGGVALYLIVAVGSLDIEPSRLRDGPAHAARFVGAFFPPNFNAQGPRIAEGILESICMAVASTALGVLISIPIGFGAASNLVPRPVYLACRLVILLSRTFPEVIIAVFLVAMLGFGPFAGILTLTIATVGFYAKLLAEAIEGGDSDALSAVRSTGATWRQQWNWAVWPQVLPRVMGLAIYRLDINFRESAVIGIVGAGGIGAALQASFARYEFDITAAILLIIIAIVFGLEYLSSWFRQRLH